MDSQIICDILSRNGISSDNDLGERLQVYFTLLQEWNKKIDLFVLSLIKQIGTAGKKQAFPR